ncbi:3'-5' RNA helicase YTHDC2 [Nematolebias whitei]|uniref:3'-5' RNA helicase YTHDC2 n=1 Tax=Nematolebias whitei TaxID=451745 RepID=UPI0018999CF2|nr:3'-5' RNA helicase YTHDC2 [Nematolebias whitei]
MFNAAGTSQKMPNTRNMPAHGSGAKASKNLPVDEFIKMSVNRSLERFRYSDEKEMEFPSSFYGAERAFVHQAAKSMGYISKSTGKGSSRFLTVKKRDVSDKPPNISLSISHSSLYTVYSLLQRFPINKKECADMQPRSSMSSATETEHTYDKNRACGGLNNGIPMVPQKRTPSELDKFRCSLPAHKHREEIVKLIRENRVVIVVGETGSGKTTQIPQFLLEDCSENGQPCRMFCTQPRRLAAIAVAERVAAERGESVGQTIGYHSRLESMTSPMTLLTFCTSGVLLRTLIPGDLSLTVTHVILDDVHERDSLTDFLLTKMRDLLQKIPTLKLILSSAALDVDPLRQYFSSCPVIYLEASNFGVKEYFLEDILKLTGFSRMDVIQYKEEAQKKERTRRRLMDWCEAVETSLIDGGKYRSCLLAPGLHANACVDGYNPVTSHLELWLVRETDSCIANIFLHEARDVFGQLFHNLLHEPVHVDYTHSGTGCTALMATAVRGFLPQIQQLLSMGADINMKAVNGWTALDFAKHFKQAEALDLLSSSIPLGERSNPEESALSQSGTAELGLEEQELLKQYHHSFDGQRVDNELIMTLLRNICSTGTEGAVLIFLPGYDEIVSLRNHILYDDKIFSTHPESFQVFTLHSDRQTMDQKRVMLPTPPGVRKIILSTNMAETSITISDVVFVIDSGKVKEKSFDTLSRVSVFKTAWISKARVLQRKGRAGRCCPGFCFYLYSRLTFNNMLEFQVPQLLQMPLQDLCLKIKLLAPPSCLVAEFLSKAPQPPPTHVIQSAVQMLKTIDALGQNEELTDLGYHLADLPVEPHLGKMVLCAVILKCLDPILTIACSLAYRDHFILPSESSQKNAALQRRKRFTSNTFSDHMALLRAFQAWQKARRDGWERSFCETNFLSQATMHMILGLRTQVIGHLRAIGFVRARGACDIRDVNQNSENWAIVKSALVAGMYPNLIHVNKDTFLLPRNRERNLLFHSTSVLSQFQLKENSSVEAAQAHPEAAQALPTEWIIYDEMSRGRRTASVRCCTLVTSATVAIFAGSAKSFCTAVHEPTEQRQNENELSDSDSDTEDLVEMKIDDWLVFELEKQAAGLVSGLRQKWQSLFMRRIRCPSKPWSQQDEAILQTLISVLGAEEMEAGLQQPTGIGQRPIPMSTEDIPQSSVRNFKDSPKLPTNTTNDK